MTADTKADIGWQVVPSRAEAVRQVRVGRIGAGRGGAVPITTTLASGTKPTGCGTTASSAAGELGRTTTLGFGAGGPGRHGRSEGQREAVAQ